MHNEKMETPVAGMYVAGNITGIESAKVARAQGYLAGLSIVRRLLGNVADLGSKVDEAVQNVKVIRGQATIQFPFRD